MPIVDMCRFAVVSSTEIWSEMQRSVLTKADSHACERLKNVERCDKRAVPGTASPQANQAKNDLLWRRMDEWGCDLVFTSAHYGARPTHAVWQGKVFSRSGRSSKYPPLVESTGYGTAAGLCGVNCRHTMTPYVEGKSKLPDTEWAKQERLTGMTSSEYYGAAQAQRRLSPRSGRPSAR